MSWIASWILRKWSMTLSSRSNASSCRFKSDGASLWPSCAIYNTIRVTIISINLLTTVRCVSNFKFFFFSFYKLISWALPVKLILDECHRAPLIIKYSWKFYCSLDILCFPGEDSRLTDWSWYFRLHSPFPVLQRQAWFAWSVRWLHCRGFLSCHHWTGCLCTSSWGHHTPGGWMHDEIMT